MDVIRIYLEDPSVVSVFENEERDLHTTRSWNFLGVESDEEIIPPNSIWKAARFGEDTIIGNLDTGLFSLSFALSHHFLILHLIIYMKNMRFRLETNL